MVGSSLRDDRQGARKISYLHTATADLGRPPAGEEGSAFPVSRRAGLESTAGHMPTGPSLPTLAALAALCAIGCHATPRRPAPTHGGISGVVHDRFTGEAVAAVLTVHEHDSLQVDTARTAGDGSYQLDQLEPGRYDMIVVLPGTTLQLTGIPVTAGHVTAFDVPIDRGAGEAPPVSFGQVQNDGLKVYYPPDADADQGRLEGTVTDSATHERIPGAVIIATSPATSETLTGVTDDRGWYRFTDLPPGEYTLSAFYQVARRGQIEVRRSGVAVAAGSVVIAPIYVDVMGTF